MKPKNITIKKFILLVLIILTSVFAIMPASASQTISDMQNQIELNTKKQKELAAKIKNLKNEQNSTQNEINLLDLQLESLSTEAEGLQLKIDDLNEKIKANETSIEILIDEIDKNNVILEKRLRASYKRGGAGYLELILNADNILDALTRIDMIQRIVQDDVDLLKDIQKQKDNLVALKEQQEQEKLNVETAKADLNAKLKEVEASQAEKESYMIALEKDMKESQAMEEKMEQENARLEKEIQQKMLEMAYAGGSMIWPLPYNNRRITSDFGKRIHPLYGYWTNHRGIDIACPYNTEVYAVNSGVVQYAGYHYSYGWYVIIDHGGKIATLYAHNTKLLVQTGQKVSIGDVIALSGSTGESTGPHLHFEVRKNGVCVDPKPYLP